METRNAVVEIEGQRPLSILFKQMNKHGGLKKEQMQFTTSQSLPL